MTFDYEKARRDWKWDIPEYFNIASDCVDRIAETRGESVCLYWENHAGESKTFTYSEMKKLTDRFGAALRSLGVKKGDRILLRLPNVPEFHIAFLGAMKIGALPIPSSTMFKEKELEYLLNDSGACV
ncbi:AMP-binding protein, partial [bacterium]